MFVPLIMARSNTKTNTKKCISWQEGFGTTKDYFLYFVRSESVPMRFAMEMSRLMNHEFSFLTEYVPVVERSEVCFPIYFSTLDDAHNVNMLLMSNAVTVQGGLYEKNVDPLLGEFIFDDYYYFFNDVGKFLLKCPYRDYDYMLLVSCDKDYQVCEYEETLKSKASMKLQNVSSLLVPAASRGIEKQRSEILQNLFMDTEVMISKYNSEHLSAWMGRMSIPLENYVSRKASQMEMYQVLTSPLLKREDV